MADMSRLIRLITVGITTDSSGTQKEAVTAIRPVFCSVRSVGMKESYTAMSVGHNPEVTAYLNESADYHGETFAKVGNDAYKVIRTYRKGYGIELTLEKTRDLEGML